MRILNGFFLSALMLPAADRLIATGAVIDGATRQPIAGATILVHSAGVRTGYDLFCPTCYVDCGKRAVTDAQGGFSIPSLSPDLIFNLLVVREGYGAGFIRKLDPQSGAAPPIALKPRISPEDPRQVVRGKVVDAQAQPVREALISQQGIIFDQGRQFGDMDWIDLVAVSNREGEFEMAYAKPAKSMILEVAPRGMAPKLAVLPTGLPGRQIVAVTDGATIRGRLVSGGKPVPNAEFVLSTHSRTSGTFYQDIRIGTNNEGEFVITNTPAGRVWDLFPKMDSLAPKGLAAPLTFVATKDDGQEIQLGDIEAKPGYSLRGRFALSDGLPIAPGMRLNLFMDRLPDRQSVILPPDGTFEFKGLAKGIYTLLPAVKGYLKQDPEQPIEILIEGNRAGFNVLLNPVAAVEKAGKN